MKREVFVLTDKGVFRRTVKVFLKDGDKKDQRNLKFTTEHKINEKDRPKGAKKIAAEFSTTDEKIIDGLYRDTGYGITFTHIDDPKGERKREPFNITPVDAKKIALRNLFKAANLDFDPDKTVDVLTEEYSIHVAAQTGKVVTKGSATEIIHKPVDVAKKLEDAKKAARDIYEEKYGEPIPDEFRNDIGLLDGLTNPDFDAKAYIDSKTVVGEIEDEDENPEDSEELPSTAEELQELYVKEFGNKPANAKKNDIGWLKNKILENRK